MNSSLATQTVKTSNFSVPTYVKTKKNLDFLISRYGNADFDKAIIWIRQKQGADPVSIETVKDWNFLNDLIQKPKSK